MFIRSVKVPSSHGTVHEYVRIVSSVRKNGKVKQKVIANLGRRDTLEAVLPMLYRFLQGASIQQNWLGSSDKKVRSKCSTPAPGDRCSWRATSSIN